jgi:hypothetical protein
MALESRPNRTAMAEGGNVENTGMCVVRWAGVRVGTDFSLKISKDIVYVNMKKKVLGVREERRVMRKPTRNWTREP